ncbi:MAG: hypothetical protein IIY37_00480 [Selenomonadaceae bacterium]|nr:hypothetical protein [Selenomonadaceae bacterium]MBQ1509320.1 hypothetical protein [Selenomonadaceae bacterium]MBQ1914898.1 hypothetical protein [Selenomonadaceae bacterium]MBQ3970770.1 hypothetical protein [Selenomonadaceae bacterium]
MDDKTLDAKLAGFDYSSCHPIRESLKERLMNMHRMSRMSQGSSLWATGRMSLDDLDYAAAAGRPEQGSKPKENERKPSLGKS